MFTESYVVSERTFMESTKAPTLTEEGFTTLLTTTKPMALALQEEIFGDDMTGRKARIVVITAGVSRNGNEYPAHVLRATVPMFEGAKVFYNHTPVNARRFQDLAGELTNVFFDEASQSIIADFACLEADEWLRSLLRTKPHLVGFSIFVWAKGAKNADGTETVETIGKVQSVDIVCEPAAGGRVLQVLENTQETPAPELNKPSCPKTEQERKEPRMPFEQKCKELTATNAVLESEKANLKLRLEAVEAASKTASEKTEADIKAVADELATIKAENAKLQNETVLESYISTHKETLSATVEGLIRSSVKSVSAVTVEQLDTVRKHWESVATEILKEETVKADAKAKADTAPHGVAPKTENTSAPKGEDKVSPTALVENAIFGIMDVAKPKTEDK